MTLQDMDICLNVSAGPAASGDSTKASRKKSEFFKPQAKRLARKLKSKDSKSGNVDEKSVALGVKVLGGQTRIKQKSLAAIVAKNKAEAKNSNSENSQIKSILKQSEQGDKKTNNVKSVGAKQLTNTIVSFAKPSESGLKTILAKPKVENKSGKSLSDIFSKGNSSGENSGTSLLNPSYLTEKPISQSNDVVEFGNENNTKKSYGRFGNKKNKFQDEKSEIQLNSDRSFKGNKNQDEKFGKKNHFQKNEKSERTFNKPSGKISSLFGNNPEVPNIGQRLVKPVSETVFSKTGFADLDIHPFMVSNLEQNMQITNMTTVQQKAIPQILSGKDILVRSQTGSGKTLTYALPIVESLHKIRPKLMRNSGLKALVIVPTRELALQTYECFLKLIKPFTWIVPGYLVGGEKRKAEKARLRRGCTILVATPGRLLDHIKHTEALKLSNVKCFVLDEADRMLDMGYEKDISEIVSALKVGGGEISDPSGYDPMSMLRQNKKIIFDDQEPSEDKMKEENKEKNEDISEDSIGEKADEDDSDNDDEKREYHSGTDSDDEAQDFPIRMKKIKKIDAESVEKIEEAVEEIKPERQTVLLSATLTSAVEKLAGLTMTNPIFVDAAEDNLQSVGGNLNEVNEDLVVPQSVIQTYVVTPPKLRMVTLSAYIAGRCQSPGQHKILVFVATQDMVDYYSEILSSVLGKPRDPDDEDSDPLVDVEFFKLHGSMSQKERTEVFKTFRQAKSGVLFCTDVAARGLDMPKVDTVVQYTGPLSARDYVHRIGRTARAGSAGTAIIFLTPPEIEFVRMLEKRRIRIKQEDMNDILDKLMGPLSKQFTVQAAATDLQNQFENLVIENKKFHEMACKAYSSWVCFYSSYPRDMREMFNRKELHLGHYAKSFALRDPPQRIGGIGKTLREKNPPKVQHNNRLSNERPAKRMLGQKPGGPGNQGNKSHILKRSRMLNTSEYGDGLESIKKSKKK